MLWVGQSLCFFLPSRRAWIAHFEWIFENNEWENSMYVKALQKYGTSVSKHQSADCVAKTIVASVTLSILTVQKKKTAKIAVVGKPPGGFFSSCEVIWALPSQGGRAAEAPVMGGWPHPKSSVWVFDVCQSLEGRTLIRRADCPAWWKGRKDDTDDEETRKELAVVLSPLASWKQDTRARSAW